MVDSKMNRHRINRAKDMRSAWLAYERLAPDAPDDCQLRDMLADFMHLAARDGVDFDHELSMAADFFGDEAAG